MSSKYLILGLMAILFVSGCCCLTTPEQTQVTYKCPDGKIVNDRSECNQATVKPTTTLKTVVAPTPTVYKIGNTIRGGNLAFTVNSKRTADKLTKSMDIGMGQPFVYEQKPSSGKHYLIVDVTVENIGSSPETISSLLQMKLQDSRGYAYTPDIMTVTFLDMPFGGEMGGGGGELSPGQKMRGEVAFQVSDSATGLQFIFDYEFFGLGQAIVDLET